MKLEPGGTLPIGESPAIAEASPLRGHWDWFRPWAFRLVEFGSIQVLVQAFTALAGLLIVRSLSKADFALFSVTNSMQTTGNLLAELGIGIGLRSIGGRVWDQPERFGQLLNTALGLRRQFAFVSLAVTLPVAGWMLARIGAPLPVNVGLCLCVAAGVVPLLGHSVFTTSLQLHAKYRRIQQLDLGSAILRLALIGVLAASRINALLTAIVGVVGSWVQYVFARRWARNLAHSEASINRDDRRDLIGLSLRSLPNMVFFCLQGQVTLLILSWVGNSTGVADISAISRITALFAVFAAIFISVLSPRFARCQDPARLPRLYALLLGMTILTLAPLLLVAWLMPAPLLWLLGPKYAGLGDECVWVAAAGSLVQLATVMYTLNTSKAWIRVQAVAYIPAIVAVQVIAAVCLDLHSFHQVLIFNVVTVAAPLPVYALDAWLGLRRRVPGPKSGVIPA